MAFVGFLYDASQAQAQRKIWHAGLAFYLVFDCNNLCPSRDSFILFSNGDDSAFGARNLFFR